MLLTSLSPSSGSFLFPFVSRATSFCPFNSLFPLIFSTFLHFLPSHAIPLCSFPPSLQICPLAQLLLRGGFLLHPLPHPTEKSSHSHHQANGPGCAEMFTVWLTSCTKLQADSLSFQTRSYIMYSLFCSDSGRTWFSNTWDLMTSLWMSPMNLLSCLLTRSLFIFNNYSPADLGSISPIRLMYVDVINWTGFKTEIISIKGGYKAEFWSLFTGCVVHSPWLVRSELGMIFISSNIVEMVYPFEFSIKVTL